MPSVALFTIPDMAGSVRSRIDSNNVDTNTDDSVNLAPTVTSSTSSREISTNTLKTLCKPAPALPPSSLSLRMPLSLDHWQIPLDMKVLGSKFSLVRTLNANEHTRVGVYMCEITRVKCVVKLVWTGARIQSQERKNFEILQSPSIPPEYLGCILCPIKMDTINDGAFVCDRFVFPLATCDLFEYIDKFQSISFHSFMVIASCISNALLALEFADMVHGDLKPENILVKCDINDEIERAWLIDYESGVANVSKLKKGELVRRCISISYVRPEKLRQFISFRDF